MHTFSLSLSLSLSLCVQRDYHKMWGMTLTDYDRVLVLDADTMLLEPLDDVFEDTEDIPLSTTIDWEMVENQGRFPPLQTGFLLFNPRHTVQHFEQVKKLIKRGDWSEEGWENSRIGNHYGGGTTAGILNYFYLQFLPGKAVKLTETVFDYVSVYCRRYLCNY